MTQHGQFIWNELMTHNVEEAMAFYHDCLGWEYSSMLMDSGDTYWLVAGDASPLAGLFEMHDPEYEGVPDHWMAYIAVDDLDSCVAKAKEGGAA